MRSGLPWNTTRSVRSENELRLEALDAKAHPNAPIN
jgi:hypothetical protein